MDTVLLTFLSSLTFNIDDGGRRNKIGRTSCNTYVFFHFVSQEELMGSKVIILSCTKLILRVSYLFVIFWKKLRIYLMSQKMCPMCKLI